MIQDSTLKKIFGKEEASRSVLEKSSILVKPAHLVACDNKSYCVTEILADKT